MNKKILSITEKLQALYDLQQIDSKIDKITPVLPEYLRFCLLIRAIALSHSS